jgi:predicted TIM-barrel fold metal-dependent hydrolase
MPVIDVDCHFDVVLGAEEHPLREWADRLPTLEQFITDANSGDLGRSTPEQSRPDEAILAMFLPDENRSSAEQAICPGKFPARFPVATPEERIGWFDGVGIDYALMNPGSLGFLADYMGNDLPEAVRRCNDFMADRLAGSTGRMLQVSLIDWHDLNGAVAELQRMHARGSRAFWVRAEPYNGVSPAHPDWDRVWSAATDLGMVAILHVGNTPARFEGGWGNVGWESPGGAGLGVAGPWPFETTPGEMVRHNVRATPLMGLGDVNVADGLLQQLPEMLIFSSDYPHGEGNADPIALYEPALSSLDEGLRASFLGANKAECFARTGDPLPDR